MKTEIEKSYVRDMIVMHYLYLLAADRFLYAAMRDVERQGHNFKQDHKMRMNRMLNNAKALSVQYDELFKTVYGLKSDPRQADAMRRDATFLARIGCKVMDTIAEDPELMAVIENVIDATDKSGMMDLERINREFIFR